MTGLTFAPVTKPGQSIVVSIYGRDFSSQIGILVNGTALLPSVGLAQPLIKDDSTNATSARSDLSGEVVHGSFERVDSGQLVAVFKMPDDFSGTPNITLIAPGKATSINMLSHLYINKNRDAGLADVDAMFKTRPSAPGIEITSADRLD